MESCHQVTLEDSRGRVPLPRFGGDGRERPADGAAAETSDSLEGPLHDPRRWGRSSAAICPLGERLDAFWRRFRRGFKTCTRDTSGRADDSRRGPLTMDGERHLAPMARHMTGDDGPALQHFMSHAPWSGPVVCQQLQAEITATPAWAQGRTRIVDESAEEQAGTHHAGAARQYNGRMGQVEGCRVDTGLTYAHATVGLWARVEGDLCLPHEGVGPHVAQRRKEWGLPEERTVETKLAWGVKMVKRAQVKRLPCEWLAGDALYGRDRHLRADVDTPGVW